jgi:hypothetical protein
MREGGAIPGRSLLSGIRLQKKYFPGAFALFACHPFPLTIFEQSVHYLLIRLTC